MRACSVVVLVLLCGCSGEDKVSDKRVLARNVLLKQSSALQAKGEGSNLDKTTKVLAENVVFENTDTSTVTSDNVQGAIEELSVDLQKIMVGTWSIANKNQESMHSATGRIVINSGGTFNLEQGSFAAIGMGTGTDTSGGDPMLCGHEQADQTYEFYTSKVVVFRHTNQGASNNAIPTLLDLQKDQITFLGSGGCGEVGRQRVSILTRVSK